ncbi:conserved hypothetical protein [Burkholderia multivorans CGD2M]|nr:conserved hypothetical protein [Burkholderia multivorans CGD2]EEE16355.1 conserved hypothetical protein [Burkholderia multivorans CGD2M]
MRAPDPLHAACSGFFSSDGCGDARRRSLHTRRLADETSRRLRRSVRASIRHRLRVCASVPKRRVPLVSTLRYMREAFRDVARTRASNDAPRRARPCTRVSARSPRRAGRAARSAGACARRAASVSRRWYGICILLKETPRRHRARCDPAIPRSRAAAMRRVPSIRASNEVMMDALPNSSDTSFQIFLAKLLEQPLPEWTEKQQMELEMARALSTEMVRLAESLRGSTDLARCLVLLRYSKVLDFILTSLAARRDIHPQTLRTLFRLANLKVDDAYPV